MNPSDTFKCERCGDCCKGYGGTFLTEKDIKVIADYIDVGSESFIENYCEISGKIPILAQRADDFCVFWDGQCTIHPVKPKMCKAWPFIESVLIDINNWHIMAAFCPGIRTDVPVDVIKECVKQELLTDLKKD